jgi:hypothetical protein
LSVLLREPHFKMTWNSGSGCPRLRLMLLLSPKKLMADANSWTEVAAFN